MSGTEKTADASWKIPEETFGVRHNRECALPGSWLRAPSMFAEPHLTAQIYAYVGRSG